MKMTLKKLGAVLGFALVLGATAPAFASGGDSSADAAGGFVKQVQQSTAVIIRVPINAQGQELTDAAEVRLHQGADISTSGDFQSAFEKATAVPAQPNLTAADVSRDSSTFGWFGGYNSCGWQNNYFYNYRPSYYSYGSYYQYYQPYYQNYYGYYNNSYYGNYYGYRYYYYGRCW